ncbi:hypothetical protein A9Q84_18710 [Halobacteriovorax marinus]|uniref:HTH lysR-type domain-containing protein n=1 Tax=Halobacteriovorax marinus TaxID=97084 RepID=A0A1Y5F238_9BACT|nr:hypothetical protein A9Q84_18710 [Halobacteriovorax marinus]
MELKYDELKTFLEVHKAGTFTKASAHLGLSQSALSQKIARIEEVMQAAVFVRHPRSLSLTATGEKLLSYAKEAVQMQEDFLGSFDQYQNELSGTIRVAAFSSIMRSILIPKLASLQRKYPGVSIEYTSYEMFELESILKSNRADFIITDYEPKLSQTEQVIIGEEEYVIIEAKKYKTIPNTFLDHTSMDNATESYFQVIGRDKDYNRMFMGDVYSIIDGVALGLGRAVMSKHLVVSDKRFIITTHKKKYIRPLVLSYSKQNYYSPLQKQVLELLS